jgi:hypothetical protein
MKISELFVEVLDSPGMFIGNKSITRLSAFIDGYWLAIHRGDKAAEDDLTRGFNEWVAKRFRITTSHNWADIILFMSGGNENAAFDMTKELWEEYEREAR